MLKLVVVMVLVASGPVFAAEGAGIGQVQVEPVTDVAPKRMNLQGFLTDNQGNPVEGTRAMIFRIYRDNVMQWEESQDVEVSAGLFSVEMGTVVPIPSVVFGTGVSFELELLVTGQALSPRVPLTSTGFSFHSAGVERPLTPALGSDEIDAGAVTMEKINQSGAQEGQVITWTGSAWAPRTGGGGGGVTSVSQGNGVTCTPNPITTTGTVSLDETYLEDLFIENQGSVPQDANFMISGAGQAEQFAGISATTQVPGIYGDGVGFCSGVYGTAASDSWAGVTGDNSATDGVGTYGFGDFAGAAGACENPDGSGVFGSNTANTGTGLMGAGNGQPAQYLTDGSGGAFTGTVIGAFGYCSNGSGDRGGGYFSEPGGGFAWVAANIGGVSYKIGGQGQVSTSMPTRAGEKSLFAPEMPEPWLEDCGRARLENGHCRVDLEPLFSDCVTADADHPLNVFVTLNDDCHGVYVKTDARGFDVHELNGGTSDAEFTWRALGRWKGYEDLRMPDAPPRLETTEREPPSAGMIGGNDE